MKSVFLMKKIKLFKIGSTKYRIMLMSKKEITLNKNNLFKHNNLMSKNIIEN